MANVLSLSSKKNPSQTIEKILAQSEKQIIADNRPVLFEDFAFRIADVVAFSHQPGTAISATGEVEEKEFTSVFLTAHTVVREDPEKALFDFLCNQIRPQQAKNLSEEA